MKTSKKLIFQFLFALIGFISFNAYKPFAYSFFESKLGIVILMTPFVLSHILPLWLTMKVIKAHSYKKHFLNGVITSLFIGILSLISVLQYQISYLQFGTLFIFAIPIISKVVFGVAISSILAIFIKKTPIEKANLSDEILDS